MHKRLGVWLLAVVAVFCLAFSARAQQSVVLDELSVGLLPEYDDPGMLVIEKFRLPAESAFPAALTFQIPAAARLNAVAYEQDGDLYYESSAQLNVEDGLQQVSLVVRRPLEYRIEYYLPLEHTGSMRKFTYRWSGDYPVRRVQISLSLPTDATDITTNPPLAGELPFLTGEFQDWKEGQPFTLEITYRRSSDAVQTYQQPVEPAQPLEENIRWSERMLTFWPWLLGGLGLALIAGGGLYYWLSGRSKKLLPRRRHTAENVNLHCHQCGQRAQPGDRFCRTCGTRLRREADSSR